ncbi:unnamed protein product [Withania somnifera]
MAVSILSLWSHYTFLEVAEKIADRGFSIDLCSTPINLSFIKEKIPHKYSSSIQPVELHLPDTSELPPHYHSTNGLPAHLLPIVYKDLMMAKPQFYQIMKDRKPDVLVHDIMTMVNRGCIYGATSCYHGHFHCKTGVEFPFPALYLKDYEIKTDRPVEVEVMKEGERIMLLNTSRAIDGKYMDYLSEIGEVKILPTGEMEITESFGKEKEHSSVYICFRSENFLTKEEMEEVAYGLELSNANFIWLVRLPRGEEVVKLEEALPQGFLERIGERRRILEGWAPQTRIIKHESTGAFVTHCGWNSTLESIEFGVPIIALPMNPLSDQPINARLNVENGIAVELARDGNGKLHRGSIAEILKDEIFGESGENLRRKVKSLRENIKLLAKEEMDEVAEVIKQLFEKKQSEDA